MRGTDYKCSHRRYTRHKLKTFRRRFRDFFSLLVSAYKVCLWSSVMHVRTACPSVYLSMCHIICWHLSVSICLLVFPNLVSDLAFCLNVCLNNMYASLPTYFLSAPSLLVLQPNLLSCSRLSVPEVVRFNRSTYKDDSPELQDEVEIGPEIMHIYQVHQTFISTYG